MVLDLGFRLRVRAGVRAKIKLQFRPNFGVLWCFLCFLREFLVFLA